MIAQHQNLNLQMKPQAVSGSDISLSKATSRNNYVSNYLAPDPSEILDPFQGID